MNVASLFHSITTFIFDMDGVLTDGTVWAFANGEQVRRMNIKDGFALQLAVKKKYRVVVISGSESEGAALRLQKLGIRDIFMNVSIKSQKLEEYMAENGLRKEEILFMGDDVPDIGVGAMAGICCAPSDAASDLRKHAAYISPYAGGNGCVRDIIEKVLKVRGHWETEANVTSA